MTRELWLDFDATIINSWKTFVDIHNLIMGKNYINKELPNWENMRKYSFEDILPNLTPTLQSFIFNSELMFENPLWIDDSVEIINEITKDRKVHIVSHCGEKSAIKKYKLIKKHMPNVHFQPVLFTEYSDKSHINMKNGIFVDDVMSNLTTSNAWLKVCFKYQGIEMDINENWKGCTLNRWRKDVEGVQLKNLLGVEVK